MCARCSTHSWQNTYYAFWSEEKLAKVAEFDGGNIFQRVQDVKYKCKEKDLDAWAYVIVQSRANHLQDKTYAMTPLLDMLNHDSSSKTSARILENELFLSVEKGFVK